MPRLTIIVPLMDQVDAFETTLASVLRHADAQVDVLIVHSGDYADPHQILDEIPAVVVDGCQLPSRVGRVAMAAAAATAPWVLWIAPGIELTEAALQECLTRIQRRDLGLISPRIQDAGAPSAGNEAGECLASSVVLSARCHPLYLEEVVGEQWTETEAEAVPQVCGPTGWAGLCQRVLLERWAATPAARLANGYAELTLGLLVQQQGWEHVWLSHPLSASGSVRGEIERGYVPCGRAANQVLGIWAGARSAGLKQRSLGMALAELLRGCLAPRQFQVAWQRLQSLGAIATTQRQWEAALRTSESSEASTSAESYPNPAAGDSRRRVRSAA